MDWLQQEWVKDLITLGSIIAAILAWVAKLRWSKEFADAKDATIQAKDEQIKTKQSHVDFLERENRSLQEQTPEKLLERYKTIQKQLEDVLDKLTNELNNTKAELQTKNNILDSKTKQEADLRKEIEQKEVQIKNFRRELIETQVAQTSAQRLVSFALDLRRGAFQERMEKYGSFSEYTDHEDRFTPRPEEPTVENMVQWFLENYKDPADGVPWDDGEYVYIYGGPYHADDVLEDEFEDAAEEDIASAVDEIERISGTDWVKKWQY